MVFCTALSNKDELSLMECSLRLQKLQRQEFSLFIALLSEVLCKSCLKQHNVYVTAVEPLYELITLVSTNIVYDNLIVLYDKLCELYEHCDYNVNISSMSMTLCVYSFTACI